MANLLTPIIYKTLADGLFFYRQQLPFVMSTNRDYGADAAKKGDAINVPIATGSSVRDAVSSMNRTNPLPSTNVKNVQILLTEHKLADFSLTDVELTKISSSEHFEPMAMHAAFDAHAEAVENFVASKYTEVYNYYGTAGTTPYEPEATPPFSRAVRPSVQCRKILNALKVPSSERTLIVDGDAEANMLMLDAFSHANATGGSERVIIDGEIGIKYGFRNIASNNVKTHITGAGGTPAANGAQTAVNATTTDPVTLVDVSTLDIDGLGTDQPVAGDLFTIAGNTQSYTVVSATVLAAGASTLTISPALVADVADGALLSFVGDHVANLAFHKDAITYVERPLDTTDLGGAVLASTTDPQTGLSMRMEVSRRNKAWLFEIDKLYGAKVTRPEAAVRLLG